MMSKESFSVSEDGIQRTSNVNWTSYLTADEVFSLNGSHSEKSGHRREDEEEPEFETAVRDMKANIDRFFDNHFEEAMSASEKWSDVSIPYSHAKANFVFYHAVLTLEKDLIEAAKHEMKRHLNLVNSKRKQHGFGKSISNLFVKVDYNEYKEIEVQSEICYAESLVMLCALTLIGEQNLMSLVRGAVRLASANSSLNLCLEILKHRTNWESEYLRQNFESAVRTAAGTSNLILSHLPSKVLKIMSIAGFYGDREVGVNNLRIATTMSDAPRYQVACLIVMGYNLYLEQVFGIGEGDLEWAQELAQQLLGKHPEGAFFLFLMARVNQLRGEPKVAIKLYHQCLDLNASWKQIDNICFWDMSWCYAVQMDWENAAIYAKTLQEKCQWSPATNCYQMASFKYMIMDEKHKPRLREEISQAMENVPKLRVRYGGKTIPLEKFAIESSIKYFDHNEQLLLPALELFYIWNIFSTTAGNPKLLNPILQLINDKLIEHENDKFIDDMPLDDYCLLLLLKGVCLKYLEPQEAVNCFREILKSEKRVDKNSYVPPHAALELGLTYLKLGNHLEARHWVERSRSEYNKFLVETVVHLRAHGAMRQIQCKENEVNLRKILASG